MQGGWRLRIALTRPIKDVYKLPNHVWLVLRVLTLGCITSRGLGENELRGIVQALIEDLKDLKAAGHGFVGKCPELEVLKFASRKDELSAEIWLKRLLLRSKAPASCATCWI